jgi:hypothetical protein
VLNAKRAEIIGAIKEVQAAVAEDAWLEDYEADEGRYKVRLWAGGGGGGYGCWRPPAPSATQYVNGRTIEPSVHAGMNHLPCAAGRSWCLAGSHGPHA